MAKLLGEVALAAALSHAAVQSAAAQPKAEGWTTYVNARFGTRADYPSRIFSVQAEPPENGDGRTFLTADGRAELSIYGAWNVENDTPKSYLERILQQKVAKASYVQATARFFVLSGVADGKINYQRCNFPLRPPDGALDCFLVAYPVAEKGAFDPIVARISRSLRGGNVYYGR